MNTLLRMGLLLLTVFILAACGGPETSTPQPTNEPGPPGEELAALPDYRGELFSGSGNCAVCHQRIFNNEGLPISSSHMWPPTSMANAARDPYWLASVRREMIELPEEYHLQIQDKCATCHLPMARYHLAVAEEPTILFDEDGQPGLLNPAHPLHALAIDGVSCTLCHQLEPVGSAEEGYSGDFSVDPEIPESERPAYGPFEVAEAQANVMQSASNFIPLYSQHAQEPHLCGACHTLYTVSVNAAGEVVGQFPEQMAYPEWLASGYAREGEGYTSCNDCHMPAFDGGVQISITGGPERSPYFQHVFVGGNLFMQKILQTFKADLNVPATDEQFAHSQARTSEQMRSETASLSIEQARLDGNQMEVELLITSQTGHKFPSGFPSRRAWLHVTVADSRGEVVFESGAYREDGFIEGNDNDLDGALFEEHYDRITDPAQVQIYEPVFVTPEGDVSTTLLRAGRYIKDNRLLPAGFDKAGAHEDIAVLGAALLDDNFTAGSDRVTYQVDLGERTGPFSVQAELLYQSIGYRWAVNLEGYASRETDQFMAFYRGVPNQPLLVDEVITEVR